MLKAKMSKKLQPVKCDDLVRLGRDYDGGYLLSARDIAASDALIGLGVCDDWSFESDFRKLNKVPVDAYDRSVGGVFFFRQIFRMLMRIVRPLKVLQALATFVSYFIFFGQKDVTHYRKFIGMDAPPKNISLKNALQNIDGENVFLKIDIEGSEYRILDDLLAAAKRTSGLAIEFHDCDLHMQRILKFVDDYPLSLVHFHINTGSTLGIDDLPVLLELTFSSSEKGKRKIKSLPHALDMPNKKGASELEVEFV